MQEIVSTLERNARDVQYGTVSVELRIHKGEIVKAIYRTTKTKVKYNQDPENNMEVSNG